MTPSASHITPTCVNNAGEHSVVASASLRLPMGICSAVEVFHKTVHQFLEEFDGVTVYMDDIIVWGSAVEEHDERLMKALERLSEVGLVLNAKKCVFRQPEIEYLGEVVTQYGLKPDPNKIQAITEMPTPRDGLELQRVLGMVTYLGRFIPNLSVRTAAFRSLLVKGNDWQWHAEHEAAWKGIKEILSKQPVLQYYDESKALKICPPIHPKMELEQSCSRRLMASGCQWPMHPGP